MYVYKLVSENLSHLGGPMGTEYTTVNWTKIFSSVEKAKRFAEKDYGKPIKWDKMSSGDLSYVMYTIKREKVQ